MPFEKTVLSSWRRKENMSQAQAANKIGVTQVYYSQLETGKRTPSLGVLENIARATGIDISDLMHLSSLDPSPPPTLINKSCQDGGEKGSGSEPVTVRVVIAQGVMEFILKNSETAELAQNVLAELSQVI